jgi:D-3-phosphoglycerate dehydrogenase
MKVIVADKISERGVELLRKAGLNAVLTTKETIHAELADADALIVRSATRVTKDLLEKAPRLRAVGRAGVGVDNIDLPEATKRGVLVMSTPGGNAVSVAEHTFALMLALARQVPKVDAGLREGRWEKSSSGTELRGKTLGLIGLGRIGGEVARRAEAFDMKIIAYDPYISEAAAKELQVELVNLERLLAESDFISLHTALSPATQNMINAKSIEKMKKSARIVNAARGELIDEAALAEALKSGRLAGAALDVFVEEPPKNSPLDWFAKPDRHAPHCGLHRGSAGRSRHAGGGTDPRLPDRRNYSKCGEPAGAFSRPVSPRAALSGAGRAPGLVRVPGCRLAAGADPDSLCRRSGGSRHPSVAQRGAGGRAERGAR